MSSNLPLSEVASRFKLHARARHIEQLRTFPEPARPVTAEPLSQTLNEYKQWLLNCSKESNVQIQQAIAQSMLSLLYIWFGDIDVRPPSGVLSG